MPVVEWFKDGAPVELNERVQQVENADGQSALIINKPTTADSGQYRCVAKNKQGSAEQTHEVIFTPPVVPVAGRREYKKPVAVDTPADDTDDNEAPEPKADKVPPPAQRHVQIKVEDKTPARGTKTEYEDVKPSSGYKSSMVIEEVEYVRRHVLPSMKEILKSGRCKLSFATHLTNRVVAAGGRAKLSCAVLGPDAMARWTKDDVAIKYGTKYKNASGEGIVGIEVQNCRPDDSGLYELTVKNQVSCLTSVCRLEVYSVRKATGDLKPTFTRNLKRE